MRFAVVALALLNAAPALAADPLGLYQGRVIVTGTDLRSRPVGIVRCLIDVLVKVSGNPALAEDPRIAPLMAHADALVADFAYWDRMSGIPHHDDQGSSDRPYDLTVSFDPGKIDSALADLEATPWRGPRPTLAPIVFVTGRSAAYLLTAEAPAGSDQRAALAAAGERYAMPLTVPALADLAHPLAAQPLPGELTWSDSAHGWVATWHLAWQGTQYAWSISGVSFDEAFRSGVRGALQILSGHGAPK